jgi:hypothetical protein
VDDWLFHEFTGGWAFGIGRVGTQERHKIDLGHFKLIDGLYTTNATILSTTQCGSSSFAPSASSVVVSSILNMLVLDNIKVVGQHIILGRQRQQQPDLPAMVLSTCTVGIDMRKQ